MSAQMTGEEMFESLTGFEEIAIANSFNAEIGILAENKPTMFLRAMVFTHMVREGQSVKDAKQAAMAMTLKEANAFFLESEEEPMPEEPVTESGEDAAPAA